MPLIHAFELQRIEPPLGFEQGAALLLLPQRLARHARVDSGRGRGFERFEVQMQRRIGESHEEHIARVTALIRQATEAMLIEQAERSRKLRTIRSNKPKFRIH